MFIKELCSMKSYTKERMQNMKNCTDHHYTFMTDWADLTSATSADTALSTLTV